MRVYDVPETKHMTHCVLMSCWLLYHKIFITNIQQIFTEPLLKRRRHYSKLWEFSSDQFRGSPCSGKAYIPVRGDKRQKVHEQELGPVLSTRRKIKHDNTIASARSTGVGVCRTAEVIYLRAFLNTLKPALSSPSPAPEAPQPILNLKMM